jgi:hypothetical protein
MTKINERPILFSAPMVRAILEGRKTVTRRPHGLDELNLNMPDIYRLEGVGKKSGTAEFSHGEEFEHRFDARCPFGKVGDHLWIRESYQVSKIHDGIKPRDLDYDRGLTTYYAAGGSRSKDNTGTYVNEDNICVPDWVGKMRPSIHMPRAACRILLEITDVRVERLQDISEEQAVAEGIVESDRFPGIYLTPSGDYTDAKIAFKRLWESTGGDWDANPWVWCVNFKVVA